MSLLRARAAPHEWQLDCVADSEEEVQHHVLDHEEQAEERGQIRVACRSCEDDKEQTDSKHDCYINDVQYFVDFFYMSFA